MPDFHQPVLLPTLHHLADTDLEEREGLLTELAAAKPIALVIPALFAEIERKALPRMLKELSSVPYLSKVIFSMNDMDAKGHAKACKYFEKHLSGIPHEILWNDGPELDALHRTVSRFAGLKHGHGKGSNVWMGIASLLVDGHHGVVVCHDSDILNYDRSMLWRLCLPVAHPDMSYVFAKSYYGRVRERMYGRVTRLLVFPLIQALREVFGSTPLLRFLAMTRYPLSGEFAADTEFLSKLGIAGDWGLEIGMLCDVFRQAPSQRFCQVDLGGNFEHKHQHLGYDPETGQTDAASGLMKMGREVIRALMAHLWSDLGFSVEQRKLERLSDTYTATAKVLLTRYAHEAVFNGLEQTSAEEHQAVSVFARLIKQVAHECLKTPPTIANLPAWEALIEKVPDFADSLRDVRRARA